MKLQTPHQPRKRAKKIAVIYPLISVRALRLSGAFMALIIGAVVMFAPQRVECGSGACLWNEFYRATMVIAGVRDIAKISAIPLAVSLGYFLAFMLGIMWGFLIAFTAVDQSVLNLNAGGVRGRLLRFGAYFLWGCQFVVESPIRESQRSYGFFMAIANHRTAMLLWAEGMFFFSACVVVCVVGEIVALIKGIAGPASSRKVQKK